jgi:hypothetical protein
VRRQREHDLLKQQAAVGFARDDSFQTVALGREVRRANADEILVRDARD